MESVTSRRVLRVLAFAAAVLCTLIVAVAATARATVVSAGFYGSVLDEESAYDRVYDQVLVDPKAAAVTRNLLAGLPVPEAVVTSNIKLVLPPETVRDLTQEQIGNAVGYLRGDRDTLDLSVDLRPVLDNVDDLAQVYFGDLVASVQNRTEPDFAAFSADLSAALEHVVAGRVPGSLPALPLTEEQAATAAGHILAALPEERREALRPDVEVALGDGDIGTVLATVAPAVVSERTHDAAARLRTLAGGSHWNLDRPLDLAGLESVRPYTAVGLGIVETVAAALLVAALAVLWFTGSDAPGRRPMLLGWALAAGGLLTALVVLLVRVVGGGRLVDPPASWPTGLARLVDDLQRTAVDDMTAAALGSALVPLVAGALLAGLGWALQVRPRLRTAPAAAYIRPLAAGASALALAGLVLVPLAAPEAPRRCEGSVRLCDRPYDEVAFLTSHNAMSTTVDRFIGPLQDPAITTQLDDGVRALQIDTYRWERPDEITARLKDSDFSAEQRALIANVVNRVNPPREGLWLCHSVCRAGAVPLVPELREIGDWMRDHPTEVLTLIVQDAISGEDTAEAFARAGLGDLVFTPDDDPAEAWPTLGDMIDSGRRLVVFAEQADGPAAWYRNFYRYGMETPFSFQRPDQMSCVPHRGGTGKRLFLLNHFITAGGGSRLDAGEVNARDYVLDRVAKCERERGRPVNFVAVDYTTIGDARGAVDELNADR
ncbi:PI-PLC domain-containing protein [Streptomyces justiciae]|uniref:PI-PLC domain-containing protein n=1 Tax=Streptomyces justiciae TaxID=2780140 RepID=UPI0021195484|nr:PI-PLC domain-containing protein [Streptomyces justiciae]MCW8378094.1 PI-PLC domain-containing protein [Streptomyces justiciae]